MSIVNVDLTYTAFFHNICKKLIEQGWEEAVDYVMEFIHAEGSVYKGHYSILNTTLLETEIKCIEDFESKDDYIEYLEKHTRDHIRNDRFRLQQKKWGFDESCTWSLDYSIAIFILPRLICFLGKNNGCPHFSAQKEQVSPDIIDTARKLEDISFCEEDFLIWNGILLTIIKYFCYIIINQNEYIEFSKDADLEKGGLWFIKYLKNLWW